MSYVTYITEALVCGTFNRNTADRTYLLFTREAGMLYADARSVREERSRQRYALQDFARIRVSLVKGKKGWKIGSVEAGPNYFSLASTREARASVVSLYRALRRFIQGEEVSPELFDFCLEALTEAIKPIKHRDFFDLCVQLKLMTSLGYVADGLVPTELNQTPISEVVNKESQPLRK
ncbi:MAG: recombination protein O N-terminal domain-containing protein [Candidatus Paceibacterota bacterium]